MHPVRRRLYGVNAIAPLLTSLRSVDTLLAEQRAEIPRLVAANGPSAAPVVVRFLNDPDEKVRAEEIGSSIRPMLEGPGLSCPMRFPIVCLLEGIQWVHVHGALRRARRAGRRLHP